MALVLLRCLCLLNLCPTKYNPGTSLTTVGVCPCQWTKYNPGTTDDSRSVSMPTDKVQTRKNSDDSGSVSRPTDKVQPDKKSEDSGSVSMPMDKIQNNDIQVNVKVTDNTNAEQELDETDELFDDPPS